MIPTVQVNLPAAEIPLNQRLASRNKRHAGRMHLHILPPGHAEHLQPILLRRHLVTALKRNTICRSFLSACEFGCGVHEYTVWTAQLIRQRKHLEFHVLAREVRRDSHSDNDILLCLAPRKVQVSYLHAEILE